MSPQAVSLASPISFVFICTEPFQARRIASCAPRKGKRCRMKGIVLWLMGVPLIVIILLYLFVF
ncbi:hypothetical protein EET67_18510 [Pseudaminobacter arsenicus]|uniref:Uncharacterized protein n=1 Tax=Borborobacter arsenicus TaxID=1851146 RepID=A0A432V2E6_9HYPH|nr:hypothetical protein EET67_18510 [Pseudaminobacter arsenicus]